MKILHEGYRRPASEELGFVCQRLDAGEVEILGKALRRGIFEIYKAVVLHELAAGRLDRQEATRRLGSLVVERALSGRSSGAAGNPGGARRTRRPAARSSSR
ncbi:MAG: hypothetical protein DMF51_05020 [Acidobacteria bacterium]|nr:MAG: hypothetical protein DMF51_05020 [Acidobacteriota bacterium]